ncbi:MAG TPA: argininosuccinate synthase [Hydrogenispora sp.]|jgi:argininosuccinate synthase|nr:argininosuccinate synthase [Hydrogenispora sp.]
MGLQIEDILNKIASTPIPKVKKCAIAYSGGLDSTLGIELLRRVYKAEEIVAINVDVGQGNEELQIGIDRAKKLKIDPILIDAKEEFTEVWLKKAIQANSDYNGYPVSTSMTRQLIGKLVAKKAQELGCDSILEGSTGRGNDQYRMHNVFKMFAPELEILAPVRDFDLTRQEELMLCEHWGVPVEEFIVGGDDKTMWCRSIASGAVDLNQPIPDTIWMWLTPPEKAPDQPEIVTLTFEAGVPVALNGQPMKLGELIPRLNTIAGRNGIGLIDIFEDGIMDLKSREIYEAPAAHVILKVKQDLEGACLTKDERQFKKIVDAKWGYLVYHGAWFHPLKKNLDAFIAESQKMVNGTTKVKLYKGNIIIAERDNPPSSLFSPEIRSIKAAGFDQRWCANAAKIRGLPFEILAQRNKKLGIEE